MATRNIVPRATGEGSIGTSAKTWSAVYANDIAVTNGVSASTFTGNLTGTASGNLPLTGGTVTGDLTVTGTLDGTASGNLPLSGGTLTGVVNGVTPTAGDNSTKIATTEFVAKSLAEARVLPGTVTAFSGTFNDGFPVDKNTGLANREWHLCDGTNGTPDLRNRFIYGGDGTNNGDTGGEASHKLTEAELPALSGEAGLYIRYNDGQRASGIFKQSYNTTSKFPSAATENCTGSVVKIAFGGDQPHNNMPPYYVLAYIMKL